MSEIHDITRTCGEEERVSPVKSTSAFVAEKPDANDLPAHCMDHVRVQTALGPFNTREVLNYVKWRVKSAQPAQ